ncbi:MAG: selenocysteine-specific translation elongation factor [Deltaproteobacteria bacterium]|nr:selenocysteine-specific translation elongation factor [Deltaproteobacteria bacterium]
MKQIILGTAGHIDHGKTSLIKALTGIDTDRLKEEKLRGITIELGFAHLDLPNGQKVGIIDVPGHEKFVKNMVAGAATVDMVALVIAADEGVMPQTREHLDICQLLSVRKGLVVLTKIDLVDEEWLEMVKDEVAQYLRGTFLADAPIVPVSSTTGQGLDELKDIIASLILDFEPRPAEGVFRLPIDRVFVMKGFGTVITGTTISGSINVGDPIVVYPKGLKSKVRGIQVHGLDVPKVSAGVRTAVNVQGLEKSVIDRGDVLAPPEALLPSFMMDLGIHHLATAPRPLKNGAKVRFHSGSAEIMGKVILLDRNEMKPGEDGVIQIRLEAPFVAQAGDRYVIRSYSPVQTIGGGKILNPLPRKHKRFSQEVLTNLDLLAQGRPEDAVAVHLLESKTDGLDLREIGWRVPISRRRLEDILSRLSSAKKVVLVDKERGHYIDRGIFDEIRDSLIGRLKTHHTNNPLKPGMSKEELRSRLGYMVDQKLFNVLIGHLTREGTLAQDKDIIRLATHRVTFLEDQQKTGQQIEEMFLKGGLSPPYFKEVAAKISDPNPNGVLGALVDKGVLVKVKEDLFYHHAPLEDLKIKLIEFLKQNKEIETQSFKDLSGVSRKYAIPLLEYFDKTQVTVRVEDKRILRGIH